MDPFVLGILLAGILGLDLEGVCTEIVALGLQQVGGKIGGAVTVEEAEGSREGRQRDSPKSGLGHDISPAGLGLVDGLVEEVAEEEVLQVVVLAVGGGDVLEEDGADNAASAPHEGDGWLVELPLELLGSLELCQKMFINQEKVCVPLASA